MSKIVKPTVTTRLITAKCMDCGSIAETGISSEAFAYDHPEKTDHRVHLTVTEQSIWERVERK